MTRRGSWDASAEKGNKPPPVKCKLYKCIFQACWISAHSKKTWEYRV